ncbi:hypothetical protein CISG_01608 [Coccidioides immitis RMSCC 3703]|uniref:Mus7/MMS22 family-domain-containing protein n=1 Tax=Coccidioides immitis RMSCC 3703 TaxID=454286 RepID=A0A0J8TVF5_COCIT|nr:hypothetical protein CISG_01608 [Coccidioides immitis RMSCC 3703]
MEQWRERGYVPDSDDEDELDILRGPELEELDDDDPLQGDTGLFARSTTANKDSNIARLQASFTRSEQSEPPSSPDELHFDEHLPARAPARPIVKAFTTLNDDLDGDGEGSSSLSSPPSTITSPWSTKSAQLDQSRAATVEEHPNEDVIQLEEIPDDILPGIHEHHGRSLRQRNAIQLHPYLLENAQYQRLLKARGLQPVRVNIVDHAPQKDSDESQNQLYQDANALPSSSPDVSFHFPPSSPGPVEPTDTRRPPLRPSSNQPQVVIRKYSRKTYGPSRAERHDKAWQSNKRRKISNSNEEARATVQVSSSQDQVAVVDNVISRSQGTSIFDVPLSPPPSGSLSSAQSFQSPRDANEFRFPPGMTPPTVATPTTETRSRSNGVQTIFAELLSEAESENDIETVQQADSDSTPETSEAEFTELRRIRRKIKGVLPASWLRLDLQEQEQKAKEASRKEALKFANRQRENAKGIARKISRTGNERINTGGSRATAFLISDDSGSDVELVGSVKPSYHPNTTSRRPNGLESLVMDLDDEDDIPEDNRIDYMYPPAPRHYISSDKRVSLGPKGGRKRENDSTSRRTQGSTRKPRRQARITDTISRRDRSENKVPRIPRLGILDAPDLKNRPSHCQPQFLRIAARCARRRCNYARQSQSRKFFRLGNRDDTQDINETLRAWRNGTIAQNCLVSWESTKECPPGLQIPSNSDPTLLQRGPSDVNDSLDVPMGDSPSNRLDAAVIGRENIDRTFHQHEMDSVRSRPATTPKAKQSRLPRHGFVVSSFKRRVPRPVEMDSSSKAYLSGGGASFSFQKTLSTLNADYRQLNRNDRLPLARFLSRNGRPMPRGTESILPPKGGKSITQTLFPKTNTSLPREPRKRRPQHIDSEAVEYRQPLEHDFNVVPADSVKSAEIGESRPLRGLHPTLQSYTVDFDTFPLQAGTYFHESTFIGSGEFARSLNLLSRDLDRNCGQSTIFDGNHVYRWGTWNDTLSSELGTLLERIVVTPTRSGARHDHAQASSPSHRTQLLQLYRSVILFASDTLSFSDPVDRKICVERCLSILSILRDGTRSYTPDIENLEELEYSVQIEMFNLVLANQIQQIASHELIASRKALEIGNVMSDFASRVLQMLLSDSGTYCIRKFLEENKRLEKREAGIRQEYPLVDAYLVTRRIIYAQIQPTKPMASDPVSKGLWALALDRCLEDIRDLERIWRSLFSLLPLHEFDELGIFRVGLRFKDCQSHWGEEGSGLVEFANWHSDFTVEMLKQHSLARTELENAVVLASTFARQSIENAITKNQRQIESLINSALTGMKKALETATTMSHAMILMEKLPIEKLLGLFNPSVRRLNGVVCQTLELLHAYTAMGRPQTQRSQVSVDTSEDSQDYGDWTGFEEIYDQQMNVADPAITYIDTVIRPALSRFVSRVFGEDQTPDDSLLTTAIDTWVEVANVLVKHRLRQWDSYLNLYDGESWASLRMTDQTRRFMPYFLASLICKDSGALSECRSRIFNHWIESLTTAILNGCHGDPLLDNLPFSVHKASERYAISLDEFCQRRISLLSCLLSNMREHLTKLEERNQPDVYLRSEYCEIIRTLMAKMRRNYEELGSPNGSGHGSYVGFVHRVVEFLQQHSQSICPIDEFFMDPTTFPLPASDPTYVVAKMKSYGTRLSVVKIAKQLVMFVQNVSERAAVDGHQVYLVDQVYKAMDHTYSEKDHGQPYLRSFLLQCVFPAYVENAFSNPVGWILTWTQHIIGISLSLWNAYSRTSPPWTMHSDS